MPILFIVASSPGPPSFSQCSFSACNIEKRGGPGDKAIFIAHTRLDPARVRQGYTTMQMCVSVCVWGGGGMGDSEVAFLLCA